jgi:hypothetical protein
MVNLKLSEEEYKLILECLLFSCSVDINYNQYLEDIKKLLDLLKKLRIENQNIFCENVSVEKDITFYDEHTEELLKFYPELKL